MLLLAMVLAFTVGTYAARSASHGFVAGQAHGSSAAPSREEISPIDNLRYLVATFRGVNDHIVAEIRRLDAMNGALLGGVVAIFVLFLDKTEYWPALPVLVVPAVLLLQNARDTINYAPDPDVFAEHYGADPKLALHDLMNDYKRYTVDNGNVLDNKRAGARRTLYWLFAACLVAAAAKGYTFYRIGDGRDGRIHQTLASRLEARPGSTNGVRRPGPVVRLQFGSRDSRAAAGVGAGSAGEAGARSAPMTTTF